MSKPAEIRKLLLLAGLVAVGGVLAVTRLRPALLAQRESGRSGKAPAVGGYKVPSLGWDRSADRVLPTPAAVRNLFAFGPPPTPTPDRRPTPTPMPTSTPAPPGPTPTPTPTPRWYPLPPPPRCTLSYIGWLGPDRLPVAVFRDGEEILAVKRGDAVKNVFLVREVGPTKVTLGFVGYPEDVTTTIELAR